MFLALCLCPPCAATCHAVRRGSDACGGAKTRKSFCCSPRKQGLPKYTEGMHSGGNPFPRYFPHRDLHAQAQARGGTAATSTALHYVNGASRGPRRLLRNSPFFFCLLLPVEGHRRSLCVPLAERTYPAAIIPRNPPIFSLGVLWPEEGQHPRSKNQEPRRYLEELTILL